MILFGYEFMGGEGTIRTQLEPYEEREHIFIDSIQTKSKTKMIGIKEIFDQRR